MSGWGHDHVYDDDSSTSWWSSMTGRSRRDSRDGMANGIFDWWRSENFQLLLVFVPFAIAAGAKGWSFDVVFSLNAIAIAGLEVFTNSNLERVCLSLTHRTASGLCSEAIPAIFPTTVGLVAVLSDEIGVSKSFIAGSVLNNILLGMGAALFFGGVKIGAYSQEISETAFELVKLTLISTSPLIICYAMIKSLADPKLNISEELKDRAVVWMSRGTGVVLLAVYLIWVFFRRVTHKEIFRVRDEQAASIFLEARRASSHHASRKVQLVLCISVTASFVAAVFCCRYLIASVGPLDESSAMYRHFIGSIILPIVFNFYNYIKSAEIARRGRDVSLSVHLTYGAGVSNVLLTLPLMLIVGWASNHSLLLDFDPFDVAILFGGVWVTSILLTGSSDYFRGFLYICLYLIIALAIYLYRA